MLKVMRMTTFFILVVCMQASARGFSQKVTLSFNNVPLSRVLNEISRQSGVSVIYKEDAFTSTVSVTIHVRNSTVDEALAACLKDQPFTYRIEGNSILIQEKDGAAGPGNALPPPPPPGIHVEGKIVDESGQPMVGVTIEIKGTHVGTATNDKGEFSLNGVDADATLVATYVDYEVATIRLNGRTSLSIKMTRFNKALEQLVVIGYGSTRKKDITSAVSTVDTKDISSRPLVNAAEDLEGKAPGVQVITASGTPGSDLSIRIRGVGSPNGSEPLYVVDGVLANDISGLDPNNIESISLLKDASAAGIYGAAGSTNGVVMITTKRGTKGKPRVEANVYTGIQSIIKKIPVLNNQEWVDLNTEIYGVAPTIPNYYNLSTTNNNWQDLIYRNAAQTGANVGLSGGSEKGTYYFGFGYLNQDGIMVGSNFTRYSAKLSVDQNATDWLTIGANLNYSRSNSRTIPQDASSQNGGAVMSALVTPEYVPIKMPANAPVPGVYGYSTFFSGDNPLSDIFNNTNSTLQNHILGNAYLEVKLPFSLKYRSSLNVILDNNNYQYFLDPYNNLYGITLNGRASQNYSETFRWAWDNTLSFNKTFGLHNVGVVVGTSALEENIFLSGQSGNGFSSSSVQTLNGASSQFAVSTNNFGWTTNSYFGRVTYSFHDKYLLAGTFRADASSRVGINEEWRTFPAVSAGWRVSNERFMQNENWIQDFKIRAGWGTTGNLPPYTILYPSYSLLAPGAGYQYSSDPASPGVSPTSQIGNPDLKWESAHQTNIGFDASFIKHRITVTADYYYKKVTDMIFTDQLPLTTGGKQTALNLPGFDINQGFEYSIDASVVKNHDFGWNLIWTQSINKNKMTGLDTGITYQTGPVEVGGSKAPIYTGIIKNGLPLGTFYGYQAQGVDPTSGNFVYSPNMMNLGSALPKFTYALTSDLRYKNFDLSLLFDGVNGNKVYDETRMEIENLTGFNNESAAVLGRWEHQGDNTSIPRALGNATTNQNAAALLQSQIASNYVESGSFFRLRNATLSYNLEDRWLKHINVVAARIYVTAQNVFTLDHYKGYYPEINGFGTGTNNQAVQAGAGTANLLALGIDNGTYPVARTYVVGINITL